MTVITASLSASASFVDMLIDLQQQLIHIVTDENKLLRAREFKHVAPVQSEKNRISAAFETQIKILRDNPMLAKDWQPERKEKLRAMTAEFDRIARENVILLQAAQRVNQRVLEAIRDAAMVQQQEHKGYGNLARGGLPQHGKIREQAVSVTLDQRL